MEPFQDMENPTVTLTVSQEVFETDMLEAFKSMGSLVVNVLPALAKLEQQAQQNNITGFVQEARWTVDELSKFVTNLMDLRDAITTELEHVQKNVVEPLRRDASSPLSATTFPEQYVEKAAVDDNMYIKLPMVANIKAISVWITRASGTLGNRKGGYLLDVRPGLDDAWIFETDADNTMDCGGAWTRHFENGSPIKRGAKFATPVGKEHWIHLYVEAAEAFESEVVLFSQYDGKTDSRRGRFGAIDYWSASLTNDELQSVAAGGNGPERKHIRRIDPINAIATESIHGPYVRSAGPPTAPVVLLDRYVEVQGGSSIQTPLVKNIKAISLWFSAATRSGNIFSNTQGLDIEFNEPSGPNWPIDRRFNNGVEVDTKEPFKTPAGLENWIHLYVEVRNISCYRCEVPSM